MTPTSADVLAELDKAEQSYADLEVEQFFAALDEMQLMLTCLSDEVTPAFAARVHRLTAIRRFTDGDEAGATESLRAAKRLQPDFRFSELGHSCGNCNGDGKPHCVEFRIEGIRGQQASIDLVEVGADPCP